MNRLMFCVVTCAKMSPIGKLRYPSSGSAARVLEIRARRAADRGDHQTVAVVLVLRLADVVVDVADRNVEIRPWT